MSHYQHLTISEREDIMTLHYAGHRLSRIAKKLGRHKSTISRELKRNSCEGGYRASVAQATYEERRKACKRPHLLDDPKILELVKVKFLDEQWSPEQISGRMVLEWGKSLISASTIDRGIYAGRFDKFLDRTKAKRKLRHRGKKRHRKGEEERRGKIKNARSIRERSEEAELRQRVGDWEGDTVQGKVAGACLLTMVDRKSGLLAGGKTPKKTAKHVNEKVIYSMKDHTLHSMTFDQGKEFAGHEKLSKALGVDIFFADPHHPWQRGSNENTNGLLREYFPKGTSLDHWLA